MVLVNAEIEKFRGIKLYPGDWIEVRKKQYLSIEEEDLES
jgi:ribosome-associated protein YbcJ (S4-like RNA binding protein)